MTSIDFASPPTLSTPPGYSHVVSFPASGRMVWTAGQLAIDADGNLAPAGDWEAQTRLVFANLGRALAAGGATWNDVVKVMVFMTDLAGLPVFRAVRDEHVNTEQPPTSTLVQVASLARPELLLEVEAVAVVI
jgi:enamine deaminase RidA (YjgF/YER057c/UK114 family)